MTTNQLESFDFLTKNDFFLFPLHSVHGGICTCYQGISCTSPGKHPLLRFNWKRIATNKPEYIRKWLQKPNINWGVPTGRRSEQNGKFLVVLDMDSPDQELLSLMPKTFSYQTGSENGRHFWFWSKYPIPNSVKKIAPNTDVRGVGGYVVIPPSQHRSGRQYVTVSWETPIADMTRELYSLIYAERTPVRNKPEQKRTAKTPSTKRDVSFWKDISVSSLRKRIQTEKIPLGARNNTLHRLLSSDRALGLEQDALLQNAMKYRSCCEEKDSISDLELKTLVGSVLRYRQGQDFQTSRCQSYFTWFEKRNKTTIPESTKNLLQDADDSFFQLLKPSKQAKVSLSDIQKLHDSYIRNIKKLTRFVKYSPVSLASRLKNMGYYRIRSSSANYWNIDLIGLKACFEADMIRISDFSEPKLESMVAMSSINKPAEPEPETFKVKVKNKRHPNEDKYVEKSTFESNQAWTKLLIVCSPEQMEDLLDRKLIIEPADTEAFMAETLPGDIIGYVHARPDDVMYTGRMTVVDSQAGCIVGEDLSKEKNTIILSKSDVSIALAAGFLEILYRDGKPYGIPEETEVEVRIHRPAPATPPTTDAAPDTESTTSAGGSNEH